MNRKVLSLILVVVLALGGIGTAFAATGNAKVDWLIDKGLVKGDERGYRLEDSITRAEAAAMVVRSLNMENVAQSLQLVPGVFPDVTNSHWANGYINYSYASGYINGYPNGTFGPSRNITYAEIIKIMVMVNGDLPETTGYEGQLWAMPYITKAVQTGITEGLQIDDYNQPATREAVFEMVYNYLIKKSEVGLENYKVIVLGNERTHDLDQDEIMVGILELTSNTSNVEHNYKKDSEVVLNIPENIDPEYLLGKVIDIGIDENGLINKSSFDSSTTYVAGSVKVDENEIYAEATDTDYRVYMENRYENSIDKLYGSLFNGEEISYEDLIDELVDTSEIAEFAQITIRSDKVLFVDAYNFSDISPVKEVDDNEVTVYSDTASSGTSKYIVEEIVGFTEDGFKSMDIKEIKDNNILHVYGNRKVIVRTDSENTGEYDRVLLTGGKYFARIDGEPFYIRNVATKRPVYSLDGSKYLTLMASSALASLDNLEDTEVMFLLDINNHLQLISGDIEINEKTAILSSISTRGIDTVEAYGETGDYDTDNFTEFLYANSVVERSLADFNRGDLVYIFNDADLINRMIRLTTASNIDANSVEVFKNSRGVFEIDPEDSWIRLVDTGYTYTQATNIFVMERSGTDVIHIEGVTMDYILETANPGSDLKAYVISEAEFSDFDLDNTVLVGDSETVAQTIVFTDLEINPELLEEKTIRLSYDFDFASDDEITGRDVENKSISYTISSLADLDDFESGDIVTLFINEEDEVVNITLRIENDEEMYEILDSDIRLSGPRSVTLDVDESEELLYFSDEPIIFGEIEDGSFMSYYLDDGEILVAYVTEE